ncbi:MAG: 4Fe-4S dicluster domain-containing protein [bacterium]|nr:4Fe-4S ferredoxin [bacterium]MBU1917402.1 4Fe-4S ferredoxin [bacterium]
MKRKIINIDEELCNGCGECVVGCAEGAIQLIDGKAKLVRDDFCDGFGDCIGTCPTGALTIEERDAPGFDEAAVKEHLLNTQGPEAVARMEEAAKRHEATEKSPAHTPMSGGCPGSRMIHRKDDNISKTTNKSGMAIPSELRQWPVQIHLVNPSAPYFVDQELVILSTCSPIACADIHWKFIRGRAVVVACPKLDRTDGYVEKLAAIFSQANTPKVLSVIMEVPCCFGLSVIVKEAIKMSGRKDLEFEEHVVSLDGQVN